MQVRLLEAEITQGRMPGEVGTGYSFLSETDAPETGSISIATRGYYQGSTQVVTGELDNRLELHEANDGALYAYLKDGVKPWGYISNGMDAQECKTLGALHILVPIQPNESLSEQHKN